MLQNKKIYSILIGFILVTGIFLRFWQLGTIPPGVHYDEAYNGINALSANETGDYKIFYPDNTGREGLHIDVEALFIKMLGNNNWGLRLANALWGSLTLIGFYFLLRQLKFSKLTVIVGTFMLATSFWHIVFSRTAYRAIMVPLILVWMIYFFWKGAESEDKKRRNIYLALSGIFLGIGFYTYIAFRVAPLILVILVLSLIFTKKYFWKSYKRSLFVILILCLVVALPILIYFSAHAKDLVYRASSVSVFNSPKDSFPIAFTKSLAAHLEAFFLKGDMNPRHNYNSQPLLPAGWSVLFALGFIISLREIYLTFSAHKKGNNFELSRWFYVSLIGQTIFWVMLIPGVLSIEAVPHSLRIIGTIPGVFILALLPLEYLWVLHRHFNSQEDGFQKEVGKKLNMLIYGLLFMVILGGISQVYVYFIVWANDPATEGAYERKLALVGKLVKQLPVHRNNYFITAYNTAISSDHTQSSFKTVEYLGYPNIKSFTYYRPLDGLSNVSCDDPQIVFLESDQWLRDQYRSKCPGVNSTRYSFDNGKYVFWVMDVQPADTAVDEN